MKLHYMNVFSKDAISEEKVLSPTLFSKVRFWLKIELPLDDLGRALGDSGKKKYTPHRMTVLFKNIQVISGRNHVKKPQGMESLPIIFFGKCKRGLR